MLDELRRQAQQTNYSAGGVADLEKKPKKIEVLQRKIHSGVDNCSKLIPDLEGTGICDILYQQKSET